MSEKNITHKTEKNPTKSSFDSRKVSSDTASGKSSVTSTVVNNGVMEAQKQYMEDMSKPQSNSTFVSPDVTGGYGYAKPEITNAYTGTSRQEGSLDGTQANEYSGTSSQEGSLKYDGYINQNVLDEERAYQEQMRKPAGFSETTSENIDLTAGFSSDSFDESPASSGFQSPISAGSSYDRSELMEEQREYDAFMHIKPNAESSISSYSSGVSSNINLKFDTKDFTTENATADRVGSLVQQGGRILVQAGWHTFQRNAEGTGDIGTGMAVAGSVAIDMSRLATYNTNRLLHLSAISDFERRYGDLASQRDASRKILEKERFSGFRQGNNSGSAINRYHNLKRQYKYTEDNQLTNLMLRQEQKINKYNRDIQLTQKKIASTNSTRRLTALNKRLSKTYLKIEKTQTINPALFSQNAFKVNKALAMQRDIAGADALKPRKFTLMHGALAMQARSVMRRYAQQDDALKGTTTLIDVTSKSRRALVPTIKIAQSANRQAALAAKRAMVKAAQSRLIKLKNQYKTINKFGGFESEASKRKALKKIQKQNKKIERIKKHKSLSSRWGDLKTKLNRRFNPFYKLKTKINEKTRNWVSRRIISAILSPFKAVLLAIKNALHSVFMLLLKVVAVVAAVVIIISFIFFLISSVGGIFAIDYRDPSNVQIAKNTMEELFRKDISTFINPADYGFNNSSPSTTINMYDVGRNSEKYVETYEKYRLSGDVTNSAGDAIDSQYINPIVCSNACEILAMTQVWFGFDINDSPTDDVTAYVTGMWYASHRGYLGDSAYYTTYLDELFTLDWQNANEDDVFMEGNSPGSSQGVLNSSATIARSLYTKLMNDGNCTKESAAAIVATVHVMTNGFDEKSMLGQTADGSTYYGIGRWIDDDGDETNSRYDLYKAYCSENSLDYQTLAAQVAYFVDEVANENIPWADYTSDLTTCNKYSSTYDKYYMNFPDFKEDETDDAEFLAVTCYLSFINPSKTEVEKSGKITNLKSKAKEYYDNYSNLSALDGCTVLWEAASSWCTPTSICNMERRYYYYWYGETEDYTQITRGTGTNPNYYWCPEGTPWSISVELNGHICNVAHQDTDGESEAHIQEMLANHPEGIVLRDDYHPHAILFTRYDAATDTYYVVDPVLYGFDYSAGEHNLADCEVPLSEATSVTWNNGSTSPDISCFLGPGDGMWYVNY